MGRRITKLKGHAMKQKQIQPQPPPPLPKPPGIFQEVRTFVAQMRQLEKAETKARELMETAEQRLNAARKARADEMVEQLLANGHGHIPEPGPPCPEEVALQTARNALLSIRRRISDLDVQILVMREKLQAEREQYNETQITNFLAVSKSAADAWANLRTQASGLAAALGIEASAILGRLPEPADWNADLASIKLNADHAEPRKLSESLSDFARDAESRVFQAESARRLQMTHFDFSAKYQVVRPVMLHGKAYAVGTRLDRFSMEPGWMSKLHSTKHIRKVEEGLV